MNKAALHLRQMAWLRAQPEKFPLPRREWIARFKGEERAAQYDVDPGPLSWLVEMLYDAGGVTIASAGMSAAHRGLGWPEIVAWVEGAQMHDVRPFWRREIMALSRVFAKALDEMADAEAEAPYQPPEEGEA